MKLSFLTIQNIITFLLFPSDMLICQESTSNCPEDIFLGFFGFTMFTLWYVVLLHLFGFSINEIDPLDLFIAEPKCMPLTEANLHRWTVASLPVEPDVKQLITEYSDLTRAAPKL